MRQTPVYFLYYQLVSENESHWSYGVELTGPIMNWYQSYGYRPNDVVGDPNVER